MTDRMANKVALITGGGGGIGAATCRLFVQEGASVAAVDYDREAAERAAQSIDPSGERALAISADLAREAEAERAVRETVARFGRLDVLVNIAGVRLYQDITEASAESWQWIIGANLMSYAFCAKYAVPEIALNGGGAIVHVSSVAAVSGRAGMVQYDTTKGGILGLTRAMAHDHAPQKIRVNAICPGATLTGFHIRRRAEARGLSFEEAEAEIRAEGASNLVGRQAEPIEIADGILFLACDESSYITGATLMVDGGQSA
jgi:NAD(P)-dependent dehydrogenase (short-subunit alcohol dehydrogenase family)